MYIYRCTLCQGHGNCVESVLSFQGSVSEAGAKQARSSFPDVRVQQRAMETYAIYRARAGWGQGQPGAPLSRESGDTWQPGHCQANPVLQGTERGMGLGASRTIFQMTSSPSQAPPRPFRCVFASGLFWERKPYPWAFSQATPTVCRGLISVR